MEAQTLACAKKNAARQRRTIVLIDESGLSERPVRTRTWAPRGQTPVLQYHFNWHQLSAIAGVTRRGIYFRLHPGAIKAPQIVDFLRHLRRHLPGKLLIVWDGLPAHRSLLVRRYVESLNGKIQIERLPAYAPELNPVEYLWGYWKRRELAHFCPKDCGALSVHARRRMQSIQRRPRLLRAFWQQAELF